MKQKPKIDVYKTVTDEILKKLEEGTVPWRQPWIGGPPANYVTRKEYRGVNALLLSLAEYDSPYWLTFKQALDCKASVRKGEKSTLVCFWKKIEGKPAEEDEDEDTDRSFMILKYFRVFNVMQCDGLIVEGPQTPPEPIAACEAIVAGYKDKPKTKYGGSRACYHPELDTISMPVAASFHVPAGMYAALFHEYAHSTGHIKRLHRPGFNGPDAVFGSPVYAEEELVAELTAAFLCGKAGIAPDVVDNAAAYIKGWMKALKDDGKLIVTAAGKAQRAADYILGISPIKS